MQGVNLRMSLMTQKVIGHKKYPHLTEDNAVFAIEREEKIELETSA
jgi:hypothetical protein